MKRILGSYAEAQALLEQALREFNELGGERNIADVHVELCTLRRMMGDRATAREHGDTALLMYRRMGNRRGAAWTEVEMGVLGADQVLLEVGKLALVQGEARGARQFLEEAMARYADLGAAQVTEVRSLLAS
ncbi:hypothetical protein IM697_25280 [Streptomyces ferrugineus]|uniref:MalT-like TPR region domain-containing protein n=1 Tax=Streptomyces ferrugineus TaxID=1413221 RepID=A0A7M2SB19_9ACTN|nr:hypothetical protein [Streptomyces ferrugineus]QOV33516.1 hypothetical protein IM697_25280 [Streptomyces ferrugineus]